MRWQALVPSTIVCKVIKQSTIETNDSGYSVERTERMSYDTSSLDDAAHVEGEVVGIGRHRPIRPSRNIIASTYRFHDGDRYSFYFSPPSS